MPRSGLTGEQYIERLEKVIKRHGVDKVLARLGLVVLYSGPSIDVSDEVGICRNANWVKSEKTASLLGGSRIDDTFLARILWERGLTKYFEKTYAHEIDPLAAAEAASLKVWGYISEQFAAADFQNVATAICGADRGRVFVRYEFPAIVRNPHIKTINGIDMQAVRDMYEVSPDEAFNLVCLTEMRQSYLYAKKDTIRPVVAWQDFFDRLLCYRTERDFMLLTSKKLTPKQKARKQEIIARYGLTDFYNPPPADWGGPVVPVRAARCGLTLKGRKHENKIS